MCSQPSPQGLLQGRALLPQSSFGQSGQFSGVFDPLYHGFQHRSTGNAHYVTGHGAQFDVGSLQNLLDAIDALIALPDEAAAMAYQFP